MLLQDTTGKEKFEGLRLTVCYKIEIDAVAESYMPCNCSIPNPRLSILSLEMLRKFLSSLSESVGEVEYWSRHTFMSKCALEGLKSRFSPATLWDLVT